MAVPDSSEAVTGPPPIRRLEEAVVNRIAAGEVIQRPASALKELMENSLDAGSTSISILIKDGGLKLISITDNGHGIRYEDLPILCERHTTSKLRSFEDLQSISTLGFRGEALASMSFVAHLTVTTMTEGQSHGYRATYKDGKLEGEPKPCAAVKGTQITVENLFYNVGARRKAFKNPGEEYSRILDVVSRFAVHNTGTSFTCKKHGDSRPDIHTAPAGSHTEAIRAVYGPSVARELIPIRVEGAEAEAEAEAPGGGEGEGAEEAAPFTMEGLVSSANYSAKKTTMVLFINDRLVECSALKRACEAVYAAILPKASKPFLYLALRLPPHHVDVNVHPTKREVSFLHQEGLVDRLQRAVEATLLKSNTSRTFYTQTLLPGASAVGADDGQEGLTQRTNGSQNPSQSQKAPEHKLVRTDECHPAGRMHAYLQPTQKRRAADETNDLAATRRAVRQRRNPQEAAELTSVQELLAGIDQQAHAGLSEILKHCSYVGMADDALAVIQHKTRLYLVNVVALSKELLYQQVLRRFGRCPSVPLSSGAPLRDVLLMALEDEERAGRWQESDGAKEEIAQLNLELLQCKAEMLREYFAMDIDKTGTLLGLPLVLDHYTPDLDRLPGFILALGNNVEWEQEKECFESVAAAIAEFYALHPPLLPRPRPAPERSRAGAEPGEGRGAGDEEEPEKGSASRTEEGPAGAPPEMRGSEGEVAWAQREWTIQHLLFPALKFFLKPPHQMANDGTIVQVACLENLYKIFERC